MRSEKAHNIFSRTFINTRRLQRYTNIHCFEDIQLIIFRKWKIDRKAFFIRPSANFECSAETVCDSILKFMQLKYKKSHLNLWWTSISTISLPSMETAFNINKFMNFILDDVAQILCVVFFWDYWKFSYFCMMSTGFSEKNCFFC